VQFFGHSFEDGVGIEEEGVPVGGIVQLLSHLSLLLFLVGRRLLDGVAVLLFDLLLKLAFFASLDDLADVLKGRLDVDDPAENHLVIQF